MANLSITSAWNETAAFVRQESRLVFPVAFMLAALPLALLQALAPPPPAPNAMPEPGLWLVLLPLVIVGSLVGNIAISYLALRRGASVAEAIARGARRFIMLLGAGLLLALAAALVFFLVAMVVVALMPGALAAAQAGAQTEALATATLIVILILLPLVLYFGARLMAMTPIAAAEEGGPLRLMARSWTLTRPHVWKLVGFLVLIGLLVSVASSAIESVAGILFALLVGPLRPGSTSTLLVILVMAALNTALTVYLTTLVARIYAQLSGKGEEVFA